MNGFRLSKIFKFIIPVLAFIFIFASCNRDDVNDDDNNNEIEPVVITRNNSAFEGDWHKKYLTEEHNSKATRIDELETELSSNPNTPVELQQELDKLESEQTTINNDLANILDLSVVGYDFPLPGPCVGIDSYIGCDPIGLEHILTQKGNTIVSLTITNEQGQSLISNFSYETTPLVDYENELQYQNLTLIKGASGYATIKIIKTNTLNITTEYEREVFFYE